MRLHCNKFAVHKMSNMRWSCRWGHSP